MDRTSAIWMGLGMGAIARDFSPAPDAWTTDLNVLVAGEGVKLDEHFMRRALRLAALGRGRTSPNPMVGAVVVKAGDIVGEGYHEAAGGPHAEVHALGRAGDKAKGATLYVTLEPCNHHGRTPPCTHAVLDAGIGQVVAGMSDPNPHVKGSGAEYLRARGIAVRMGVMEQECRLLNQPFIKHSTTGLPFISIKAAATLDGRIATRSGDSRWISNERSRRFAHQLRHALDGILVGIETALRDDPMLTVRLPRIRTPKQSIRVVLDSGLRLEPGCQLVRTARDVPLWVACGEDAPLDRERRLSDAGAAVLRLPSENGRIELPVLLRELGGRQVSGLLVEGGSRVHGAFIQARLADDFYFFYAPKILADAGGIPMVHGGVCDRMADSTPVYGVRVKRFGEDVMLWGRFHEHLY